MNSLAPIVLFVYNRPWHTEQTLDALLQNNLADQSVLFIYADGPKEDAAEEELNKIRDVRTLIRLKQWCKEVHIIEGEKNKGLADSIIDGVTNIVNQYGKIIVLEDDLVTSPGFLTYMNEALTLYERDEKVFHISGYMFPVKGKLPETFFYRQTSCWGWATWSCKWRSFEHSASILYQQLYDSGKIKYTNIDGTNQFIEHLIANIEGNLKTWAVLWHFSVFMKDGLCLHPGKSLVKNIGIDGSGEHCGVTDKFDVKLVHSINVKRVQLKSLPRIYEYLKEFYSDGIKPNLLVSTKQKVIAFIPSKLKRRIKMLTNNSFREEELEKRRVQNLPRFIQSDIKFLNRIIRIVDIASFQFIQKEIFEEEIYKFESKKQAPYIIDCGANIGLSVIYFKRLFPDSEIVAFEPDDKVFDVLQLNIKAFDLTNVELIKKACWHEETVLSFFSGAVGGRAASAFDKKNIVEVETIRLRKFLNKGVDFLKIDIEGAENKVLHDVMDLLHNVERIFVQFHSFVGMEQMLPEILMILKEAGFILHISSPGLISKNPFIQLNTYANMDNQLNIYGFR